MWLRGQDVLKPLPCKSLRKSADQCASKTPMGQPAENKPRTKSPSAQLREEPIAAVDPWRGAPVSLHAQQNEIGP
jgi:hypothetical protein